MNPEDIVKEFQCFYQKLYTTTLAPDMDPDALASLLDLLALGWLSDSERSHLVNPITADEVYTIINSIATGKAPASDGLPVEILQDAC